MEITVNSMRENVEDKTVFFTLIDDNQVEYKGSTDIPLSIVDEQAYCEANIERYMLFYRRKEYPDNPLEPFDALETFERWITDGCNVPEVLDGEGNVIRPAYVAEKVPWKGTHPPKTRIIDGEKLSEKTWLEFDNATTISGLKTVLKTIFKGRS